ncbi:Rqc2 family fibronectin-binding protein [Salsuginibacillus kocurii]|uniref:Rqc2 family fibronectin-binding protein n=1 Tax=Salsuginibacillus kocurii TaxID=427078 RepID=UPI00037D3FAB|nr:NFACT RNA binding domain-containing protein [Salsuginibacillus kocurii]
MSFDGIVTRAITHELSETLVPGRITKIKQPTAQDIILTIRANRTNHQLLVSVHPSFARLHLTNQSFENPAEPPMFCTLLRKHLDGAFIRAIEQKEMERIITLTIEGRDELGDPSEKKVIIEIMGKHSNVTLVDAESEQIIDGIKHLSPAVNRHRTIMPGRTYVFPPAQHKRNPLEADEEECLKQLDPNQGKIDKQIVSAFSGISPLVASEITHRAGLGNVRQVAEAFTTIFADISKHHYSPTLVTSKDKEYFSALPLTQFNEQASHFESMSELLEQFFSGKAERDRVKQQAYDLERMLRNEWQKNKKKLKKLEKDLQKAEKDTEAQKLGELLTANMHLVKTGMEEIEVLDYYDEAGGSLTIVLDPEKSPSDNAQAYFQKYNKAKTTAQEAKKQNKLTVREMNYLEGLLQQIESASPGDIQEMREELEEEGYIKRKQEKKKRKKKDTRPQLEKYRSSTGDEIYVGKNNKQNEHLTNRYARSSDIWLHTKDIPGSHVVIRNAEPEEATLMEAANIAAYFSKAKASSSVPVDYTEIKHVKKPSGAKPGFVTYDQQKTLYVTPDQSLIEQLKDR